MQGGAPAVCSGCGNFVLAEWDHCPWCGRLLAGARAPGSGPLPPQRLEAIRVRSWRRTRRGLVLTAVGLLLSWIPFVAAIAAIFLSLGSTFLFLGARAVHRRHEVAVVLAFLLLTIGGVIVGILVGAFLLQGYEAAVQGHPLRDLRDPASLLIWASLPATAFVIAGFALQVVHLIPPRRRLALVLVSAFLFAA
ncbi:MAG TPA: hypothetical protein VGR51_02365, partial [Thermoplasmata archaeon]|nr:hypothetical protein [Thermoplasmata archaeon]